MAARAFSYTALDSGGTHRNGVVEAETQEAAIAQLATMGRYVLEIKEGGKGFHLLTGSRTTYTTLKAGASTLHAPYG